ncbi:MAG TPA: hypothetical protein VHV26_05135 [Rhizomicrobium sp.]|jgi:hypothetical protein|nr:hypothetical protein [Rhizomicrobium sp.]
MQIGRQRKAQGGADGSAKEGVVAYSTTGDAELGDYDDAPVYFFKSGRLPPQFEE